MRKTIAATTTALILALASPAIAGGPDLEIDFGTGGSGKIKSTIEGGTYAKSVKGFDSFAKSVNKVTGSVTTNLDLGETYTFGTKESWGFSDANTQGPGAVAEAFEQRSMKFNNFARYNFDVDVETSGFGGFNSF